MKIREIHKTFRDKATAEEITRRIRDLNIDEPIRVMHVCGTHEQTMTRYGLRSLLPEELEVIAGPGCPVCITPPREIDTAVYLAEQGYIIATYGDMLNVTGSLLSLAQAKAREGDIRVVYSPEDAVELARQNPYTETVFFAIGFETTTPMTAKILLDEPPENFSILCSHRRIPPVMEYLLNSGKHDIHGFINPGHVSTIIGAKAYEPLSRNYRIPQVIAGFEPLDILVALYMLLRQIKKGEAKVENEYLRSVTYEGNTIAQELIMSVFEPCGKDWRGLPAIPRASLKLKKEFERFDAEKKFDIQLPKVSSATGCVECLSCENVLNGLLKPEECENFGKTCNPNNPIGACMVTAEGTCSIAYRYGLYP